MSDRYFFRHCPRTLSLKYFSSVIPDNLHLRFPRDLIISLKKSLITTVITINGLLQPLDIIIGVRKG
jgi:hypothetical protein